ncbi:MAG: hypothetical protein ACREA2_08870 [Blastocatellia bacterium]
MNFEGAFFLILGLIFAVPALYFFTLLVNWIAGRKLIPLWLLAALIVAALAGGSLYLDTAGAVTPVKVVDKSDTINLGRNGSWNRHLSAQVEYQSPGEIGSTPIGLRCDAATYDALRIGQTVEARVLDLGRYFKFARLKDRSTFSLIADRFPRSPRGPWRETTAVISEVTHVTEYSSRRSSTHLPWPFDIVQLSFKPDGRDQPIIAVDVVEAASAPGLVKGGIVQIVWPEDDPRSAKIKGARPGSPWANWFYGLGEILAIGSLVIAFFVVIGLRRRKRKAKEISPTP